MSALLVSDWQGRLEKVRGTGTTYTSDKDTRQHEAKVSERKSTERGQGAGRLGGPWHAQGTRHIFSRGHRTFCSSPVTVLPTHKDVPDSRHSKASSKADIILRCSTVFLEHGVDRQ